MRVYDPCSGSGGMLILLQGVRRGARRRTRATCPVRPGEQRRRLVHLQDEHAAARHPRRRHAERRHPRRRRCTSHGRRADALRPGDHQSAVLAELHARRACSIPERFQLRLGARGRQEGRPHVRPAHARGPAGRTGIGATVMPHGVLFRGGEERDIRKRHPRRRPSRGGHRPGPEPVLRHRHPRLHPGAARPRAASRPSAAGKVLFINADREFTAGRAQNYLRPEHVEKIVSAYQDVRGHPRLRPRRRRRRNWPTNDDNLNIRRYVDNTPPPEPQDVRAHLHGGVPRARSTPRLPCSPRTDFRPNGSLPRATMPTWTSLRG